MRCIVLISVFITGSMIGPIVIMVAIILVIFVITLFRFICASFIVLATICVSTVWTIVFGTISIPAIFRFENNRGFFGRSFLWLLRLICKMRDNLFYHIFIYTVHMTHLL